MKMLFKFVAVILAVILLCSVIKSTAPTMRNIGIDNIRASVKTLDDCYYTDEDIESAVECVKEHYKAKGGPVFLLRITFSDEKSRKTLNGYYLTETTDKENIIVLYCDYLVLKDYAAYSAGIYTDYAAILARENADSPWEYVDGGYA